MGVDEAYCPEPWLDRRGASIHGTGKGALSAWPKGATFAITRARPTSFSRRDGRAGRLCLTRNQVYRKVPGVRIPLSPPLFFRRQHSAFSRQEKPTPIGREGVEPRGLKRSAAIAARSRPDAKLSGVQRSETAIPPSPPLFHFAGSPVVANSVERHSCLPFAIKDAAFF